MPLEELVGILTIYEQVIQNDVGSTKRKGFGFEIISEKCKEKGTT